MFVFEAEKILLSKGSLVRIIRRKPNQKGAFPNLPSWRWREQVFILIEVEIAYKLVKRAGKYYYSWVHKERWSMRIEQRYI